MASIRISIGAPDANLSDAWRGLAARAPANVFMDFAGLCAATSSGYADVAVLQAWESDAEPEQLVGAWALRKATLTPLGPAYLAGPPHFYAFVSNPVVEPAYQDAVLPAFFDAIAGNSTLPKVVRLQYLDADAPTFSAIMAAISARGDQSKFLSDRTRPFLAGDADRKRSGSTRKKLRQDWNRLSALGAVDVVNTREPDAARTAFETFLTLEAASWKGKAGTAVLSKDSHAAFVRQFIGNLAAGGNASVALLRLDGQPVAAQVLLYAGAMAYTWKIAYDGAYAKFSPGALLVDRVSEDLLAGGTVTMIESCSPDGGFMATIWTGRRRTVDLLIGLGTRPSPAFLAMTAGIDGYARLKQLRDRLRAIPRPKWLQGS
jgi:hypothetical protein